ncbi:hypothetical protein GMLC_03230 [Geomonas limicola]|uniref:Lipoprotein n=1 Tax=Geomonas limicola TaxID=2740186 RepID=A0A6V8N434_9BACT|nr:hypothetical protein [Geomonas limicola]GFO66744.1 hypothetical protein GMLC_03230 [Geomonas limicola]
MKKIAAFVALALMISGQVLAADNIDMTSALTDSASLNGKSVYGDKTDATATNTAAVLIGKTSTGVSVAAKTGAGGYAVVTQHKSGTRAFATAYDSTSVFYKEATAGTAVKTTVSKTDKSEFDGWTSM